MLGSRLSVAYKLGSEHTALRSGFDLKGLAQVATRSSLPGPPRPFYSPKNARALGEPCSALRLGSQSASHSARVP